MTLSTVYGTADRLLAMVEAPQRTMTLEAGQDHSVDMRLVMTVETSLILRHDGRGPGCMTGNTVNVFFGDEGVMGRMIKDRSPDRARRPDNSNKTENK